MSWSRIIKSFSRTESSRGREELAVRFPFWAWRSAGASAIPVSCGGSVEAPALVGSGSRCLQSGPTAKAAAGGNEEGGRALVSNGRHGQYKSHFQQPASPL